MIRLPPALVPLRNRTFRRLWLASVVAWLGTWLQNTGAGWLMTTLAPRPLIVAMVQAATIMPVFLLALPGGALADIVDRRVFLLCTQLWTILAAATLAALTLGHAVTAGVLLALTFAIGIGSALTAPAWSAIIPELVPREDLVQAITLNGIGYNLTRAVGPALAGFLILLGGTSLAFSLYTVSILAVIGALLTWHRGRRFTGLPREHFVSAMRAGVRFVRNTPAIRCAMVRTIAYSLPASAPWALLPLVVRQQLHLGAGMYGVILGMMGVGGVTSGMLLPMVRGRISRNATVVGCSLFSCAGIALLAVAHDWLVAAGGMLLFGIGWTSAYATVQAAAQLVCPSWVRARALAIYQLAQNGALTVGSFAWGALGGQIGMSEALLVAAGLGVTLAIAVQGFGIEHIGPIRAGTPEAAPPRAPEAPAPELVPLLRHARGQVMETMHYSVEPPERPAFLATMGEVRQVRGRAGAVFWQLYEDVAHPEGWLELWSMESWTDHLREVGRMSEADRAVLARAAAFRRDPGTRPPARYLAVDPALAAAEAKRHAERRGPIGATRHATGLGPA
ncbi:MAG TPA: MFS transporter [Acetobacteraceae bacterium]|nr:MFS transporter [Acetobacteraceae bacterium]